MKLATIKTAINAKTAKAMRALSNASPEIWMGAGLVAIGVGVVLACKATLKCDELMENIEEDFARINDSREEFDEEKYTPADHARDLTVTYIKSGWKLVRLYAPSALFLGLGVACIVNSRNILRMRYGALATAYATLDQAYHDYRENVRLTYGEEADKTLATGVTRTTDEDGSDTMVIDPRLKFSDPYSATWDALNPNWTNDPSDAYFFLKRTQELMTERLHTRGVLFWNEVLDALGLDRTEIGQFAGWAIGNGDEFVDIGLPSRQMFFNWYTDCNGMCAPVLLSFNCDGKVIQFLQMGLKHNK